MNTSRVKKSEFKELMIFPPTKSKRVVTSHYFNLTQILSTDELSLLNFIIKESSVYNTIKYSTKLLNKYAKYMNAVHHTYDCAYLLPLNIHYARKTFIQLIEQGLIFRVLDKEYVINFAVTYMPQFSGAAYKWMEEYQKIKTDDQMRELNIKTLNRLKR